MTKTTMLYLVRHGQTEWNRQHRMQGRQDSPLTELGLQQAAAAAEELAGVKFAAAYCSPASRAQHTAKIILKPHNMQATVCEDFAELALGQWEGQSYDHDKETSDLQRHNFWFAPDIYDPSGHGGESFEQVRIRALSALAGVLAANPEAEKILVVAHTITIRSVLNHFIARPLHEFWHDPKMAPCSVSLLKGWLAAGQMQAEVISYAGTMLENEAKN